MGNRFKPKNLESIYLLDPNRKIKYKKGKLVDGNYMLIEISIVGEESLEQFVFSIYDIEEADQYVKKISLNETKVLKDKYKDSFDDIAATL